MSIKSKSMDIGNNIDDGNFNLNNNDKGNLYIYLNISFFMNLCDEY